MNALPGFMNELYVVIAIALAALTIIVSSWAVQFFVANHRTRIARHQPLVPYYRGLALGH